MEISCTLRLTLVNGVHIWEGSRKIHTFIRILPIRKHLLTQKDLFGQKRLSQSNISHPDLTNKKRLVSQDDKENLNTLVVAGSQSY